MNLMLWCALCLPVFSVLGVSAPKELHGNLAGKVVVQVDDALNNNSTTELEVRVLFHASSGCATVSNPFWEIDARLPGTVGIFSEEGTLLGWLGTDGTRDDAVHPVQICVDDIAGTFFTVARGANTVVENVRGKPFIRSLGPGMYKVQGTYMNSFLAENASNELPPLAVSEVVELKVDGLKSRKTQDATSPKGKALIALSSNRVKIGERFSVQSLFVNTSGESIIVYNPMSTRHATRFGLGILLSNEKDQLLSDLMTRVEGSGPIIGETSLPPNAIAGCVKTLVAGNVPWPSSISAAGEGQYRLRSAFTDCYFWNENDVPGEKCRNGRPVLQSEPVSIEFIR